MSEYTEYNEWANSFDWPHLSQMCIETAKARKDEPAGPWDDPDEDGRIVGRALLGKVMSLMPSGKYYTFYAYSNLELCQACRGSGNQPNVQRACHICNGLGFRSIEAYFTPQWLADLAEQGLRVGDDMPCNLCQGTGWRSVECPDCGGLGSREAYLDELANKALSDAAEAAGGWLESGEGDPTDLYFARWIAPEEMQPCTE